MTCSKTSAGQGSTPTSGRYPDSAGVFIRSIQARSCQPSELNIPIVASNIEARMFEFEEVGTWERNPQLCADLIGTSLAGQALFAYAPEVRARPPHQCRNCGRCRRLVQAARDNIKECPGIFVKMGLESWRGILKFIDV